MVGRLGRVGSPGWRRTSLDRAGSAAGAASTPRSRPSPTPASDWRRVRPHCNAATAARICACSAPPGSGVERTSCSIDGVRRSTTAAPTALATTSPPCRITQRSSALGTRVLRTTRSAISSADSTMVAAAAAAAIPGSASAEKTGMRTYPESGAFLCRLLPEVELVRQREYIAPERRQRLEPDEHQRRHADKGQREQNEPAVEAGPCRRL